MFLKPLKTSTDQRLRSLLQKAVRRGFSEIATRTAVRVNAIGDATWLRSRAIVITFEECWPLAESLSINRELSSKMDALLRTTRSAKQKDAAGLGALAYAYQEGDRSMLEDVPDEQTLKTVARALDRPKEFFDWVREESKSPQRTDVILAAQQYLPAATWQWDKACILGGALLATLSDIPAVELLDQFEGEFPYWVALDKHTAEGKVALKDVAREIKAPYRQLIWASFYCESTRVNKLLSSPWFDAEKAWRLRRTGLSLESAEELWSRARPLIQERLEEEALTLKNSIKSDLLHESVGQQISLL